MKSKKLRGDLKTLYSSIEPYARILRYASITWMDGREIGMAPSSGKSKPKYPILLWLYKYVNIDEMCNVITHETVHYKHPELETNEPAIEAKTQALMENVVWELLVLYKLLHSLHVSVKLAFKHSDKFSLG